MAVIHNLSGGDTKMKKILIAGIIAFALIASAGLASAIDIDIDADPTIGVETTEATISWDGDGYVGIGALVNDDASVDFETWGSGISGSLYLRDAGEYYGVSSFDTNVDADVENGFIRYGVDKLDAYYGCEKYGPLDRSSYNYIESTGTASLALNVHSDYAKFWDSGGSFVADGMYLATHSVTSGIGRNSAYFGATGDGTLDLHHERDRTIGNYDFAPINFGGGLYSYSEKSHVTQTGSGTFDVGALFENSFTMGGMTANGPVDYRQSITFGDGFSWADYSFQGN